MLLLFSTLYAQLSDAFDCVSQLVWKDKQTIGSCLRVLCGAQHGCV